MSYRIKQAVLLLVVLCAFLFLCAFPQDVSAAVSQGIGYCLQILLPAMFPYFILSEYIVRSGAADSLAKRFGSIMKAVFQTSKNGTAPFLLGLISGYPVGARCIAELYKNNKIAKQEADKLMTFCCGAGPAFVIGVLGGALYKNSLVGITLYIIQFISAFLTGLLPIYKSNIENTTNITHPTPSHNPLMYSVASSIKTSATVSAWVVLFSVLLKIENMVLKGETLQCIFAALTEFSSGSASLASTSLSWSIKFSLTSACVSFGGLCVLLQTTSLLTEAGLSILPYIIGKLTQSVISFALAYPISFLFQNVISAANFQITMKPISPFPYFFLSAGIISLLFLQIPSSIWRKNEL